MPKTPIEKDGYSPADEGDIDLSARPVRYRIVDAVAQPELMKRLPERFFSLIVAARCEGHPAADNRISSHARWGDRTGIAVARLNA